MSNLSDNSTAIFANFSGYQRLAIPYDAPGLMPSVLEDFLSFEVLVWIIKLPAGKSIFRLSLTKSTYFST